MKNSKVNLTKTRHYCIQGLSSESYQMTPINRINHYTSKKLKIPSDNDHWNVFTLTIMILVWLPDSIPDLCVVISQTAAITTEKHTESPNKYVKQLNKTIKYAHRYPTQLCYPKLDVATMRIIGYSNVAFSDNEDLSF